MDSTNKYRRYALNRPMNTKLKLSTIFKLKCPKCHKGNLFTKPGLLVVKEIHKINKKCANCNEDFKIEPDYYSVALWINYPIMLLIYIHLIFLIVALNGTYEVTLKVLIPIAILICLLIQIPIMRISKAVLLYLTINFIRDNKKS